MAVLSAGLQMAGAETVTYRRGNDSIDSLKAVPGGVRHFDYGEEATALTGRERDWIIAAKDLVLGGSRILPARGDEIDYVDVLGVVRTFQVLPRPDDRCYRFSEPTMQILRVFTVESLPNAE